MPDERFSLLDLFSGIGGFSLAFEAEGFRTIGFAEIDPYASAVLRKHWPDVPNFGDVRNVPSHLRPDVITGGVPCQPASRAGKMRGSNDPRWMWPAAIRCLRENQPIFGLFENPTGLFSVHGGDAFRAIINEIAEIGYGVWWDVVPACAVGAIHRRERIAIVAYNHSLRCERGLSTWAPWDEGGALKMLPWRQPEPNVGRMVHGLSGQSYRIKCLGNSVMPAWAQVFARAIYQQLRRE